MAARRGIRTGAAQGERGNPRPQQRRRAAPPPTQREFPDDLPDDEPDPVEPPEPDGETKREKFKRLIEPRLQRSLKAMEVLANLGSRGSYEYTENEVVQILRLLQGGVDQVEAAFSSAAEKSAVSLTFDD